MVYLLETSITTKVVGFRVRVRIDLAQKDTFRPKHCRWVLILTPDPYDRGIEPRSNLKLIALISSQVLNINALETKCFDIVVQYTIY